MTEMKILAVDDDEIILRLLSGVLTRVGYSDVRTCTSPLKALEILRSEDTPFDCFLLDIQMPGINGIELCQEIRRLPAYRSTPILMLTALSEKTYVDRAFAAGATDYLTKPFDATSVAMRLGLARQLVAERKSLSDNALVIESFIEMLEQTTRHEFDEAIDLGKMDGLLSYPAFENYLYQSGRSVMFLATVFAVSVRKAEMWHQKLPPLEFKELLRQSAGEIISLLDDHRIFLSYRGSGEFVGVVPRSGTRALKDIGESISFGIQESEGRFGAHLPGSVTLTIGDPIPNRVPTRGGLLKCIWSSLENVREKSDVENARLAGFVGTIDAKNSHAELTQEKKEQEQVLKAEFQRLLEYELRTEVGEHGRRPSRPERDASSLFRFKKHHQRLLRTKEKFLFSRADAPVREPQPQSNRGADEQNQAALSEKHFGDDGDAKHSNGTKT